MTHTVPIFGGNIINVFLLFTKCFWASKTLFSRNVYNARNVRNVHFDNREFYSKPSVDCHLLNTERALSVSLQLRTFIFPKR